MTYKVTLYEEGLKVLRKHSEEICARVMKGQSEGGGNFKYLEDPDIKREQMSMRYLRFLLWRMHLRIEGETDKEGFCDKMCYECPYKRYNFHPVSATNHWSWERPEGWYCQSECECK